MFAGRKAELICGVALAALSLGVSAPASAQTASPAAAPVATARPAPAAAKTPTQAAADVADTQAEDDEVEALIVEAARIQPGAVIGDIPPELQFSPRDIRAYGASTVTELLD